MTDDDLKRAVHEYVETTNEKPTRDWPEAWQKLHTAIMEYRCSVTWGPDTHPANGAAWSKLLEAIRAWALEQMIAPRLGETVEGELALLRAKAAVCDAILEADEYSWRWMASSPDYHQRRFEAAEEALRALQKQEKP